MIQFLLVLDKSYPKNKLLKIKEKIENLPCEVQYCYLNSIFLVSSEEDKITETIKSLLKLKSVFEAKLDYDSSKFREDAKIFYTDKK